MIDPEVDVRMVLGVVSASARWIVVVATRNAGATCGVFDCATGSAAFTGGAGSTADGWFCTATGVGAASDALGTSSGVNAVSPVVVRSECPASTPVTGPTSKVDTGSSAVIAKKLRVPKTTATII